MAEVIDILCDDDGDVACQLGDMVLGDATYQHQADLIEANEGVYKQFPTTGVGLDEFLNSEDTAEMLRKIRIQFVKDGMQVSKVAYTTTLEIKANY
jgi:hypothetical protein